MSWYAGLISRGTARHMLNTASIFGFIMQCKVSMVAMCHAGACLGTFMCGKVPGHRVPTFHHRPIRTPSCPDSMPSIPPVARSSGCIHITVSHRVSRSMMKLHRPGALGRQPVVVVHAAQTKLRTTKGKTTVGGKSTVGGKTTVGDKASTKGNRNSAAPAEPPARKPLLPPASTWFPFLTGFPFPLGPTFYRNTVRYQVEPGVWIFEQTQALEVFNVYTPVRMTVIQLESGGLWVHAPIAPTEECIRLLKELDAPVEYIILPTYAYEHKAFVGPFSRRFPKAKVYIQPYQWSWPLDLPPQLFGIFPAGELRSDDPNVPWADEIEQKVFVPPSVGVGERVRLGEVAFFHKRSRTLLVTDSIIYCSDKVPDVIPTEALLELARDNYLVRFIAGDLTREQVKEIAQTEPVEDTPANRRLGWIRMSLLVLYFGPSNLLEPEESWAALSNRVMVGPVVETLVYSKVPAAVREWVDDIVSSWNFKQIIPCHFAAPIKAGPAEFKRAFAFAYEGVEEEEEAPAPPQGVLASLTSLFGPKVPTGKMTRPVVFPEADMRTLNILNNALLSTGAVKINADAPKEDL